MAVIGSKRVKHQPSSVDKLGPEINRLIADLRIDQGWTLPEIRKKLIALGAEISKSALQRHTQSLDEMAASLKESMLFVRALGKEVGDDDANALAETNAQLLHVQIFQLLRAVEDGVPLQLDSNGAMQIARALSATAGARKAQGDVVEKAERRGEAKAKKAALAKMSDGVASGRIDPEAAKRALREMGFA